MTISPTFNTAFGALNADVDKVTFGAWANAIEAAVNAALTAPVANASLATMANNTLKGNISGATAVPADVTLGALKSSLAIIASDVSGLGALATNSTVTNALLATMADATVKANLSGATATPTDVTLATLSAALSVFSTGVKGVVPAPSAGDVSALKFLRADNSWATVTGSGLGDVVGPAGVTSGAIPIFADATGKLISDPGIAPAKGKIVAASAAAWLALAAPLTGQALLGDAAATAGVSWQGFNQICQGVVTVQSGVPFPATDQTAKTSVLFTPSGGNKIALYDTTTSTWKVLTFTEASYSIAGHSANFNFDVFVYDATGTATIEVAVWTNASTRATAISLLDGVWTKTADRSRRYVGTFRTTGTVGQTEDSTVKRYVWNLPSAGTRKRAAKTNGTSHSYTTGSWRAYNNDQPNSSIEWVDGLGMNPIIVAAAANMSGAAGFVNFGVDSTTTPLGGLSSSALGNSFCVDTYLPAAGYHYCCLIELGVASCTVNFGSLSVLI